MKTIAFLNRDTQIEMAYNYNRCGLNVDFGYANGYVAIPPEHCLYGKEESWFNEMMYSDAGPVIKTNEITYAYSSDVMKRIFNQIQLMHLEDLEIPDGWWVIGFDTFHGRKVSKEDVIRMTLDLQNELEAMIIKTPLNPGEIYRYPKGTKVRIKDCVQCHSMFHDGGELIFQNDFEVCDKEYTVGIKVKDDVCFYFHPDMYELVK